MPRYTNKIPYEEWRDKLKDVSYRLDRDFSIVYRLYSTFDGPIRYVGRTDVPFSRESRYYSMTDVYNMHRRLGIRIAFVDFRIFTGRGRMRKSYEEECKQFHKNELAQNYNHPKKSYQSWKCPDCGW